MLIRTVAKLWYLSEALILCIKQYESLNLVDIIFVFVKMQSYLLLCYAFIWVLCNRLVLIHCAFTDVTKTTDFYEFESSGNELFYNAGHRSRKRLKETGSKLENSILKSKVEVLGEVFKKHVNSLRAADNKQVSYCVVLLYFESYVAKEML